MLSLVTAIEGTIHKDITIFWQGTNYDLWNFNNSFLEFTVFIIFGNNDMIIQRCYKLLLNVISATLWKLPLVCCLTKNQTKYKMPSWSAIQINAVVEWFDWKL